MNKEGLILIDKPVALTSHDVVLQIRESLHFRKVGHFGTLDPLATGLLLIAVGRTTRFFPFYSKMDKSYRGTIKLGWATSTYDTEGEPITEPVSSWPPREEIEDIFQSFLGRVRQLPPLFSAKKFKGKPLYYLARQQKEVKRQPIEIEIYRFQLINYQPPLIEFELDCSSGTYVRTLAHDLGEKLGCGAHLYQLTRTKIGHLDLKLSFTLEKIAELAAKQEYEKFIIPLEKLLPFFPKLILDERGSFLISQGNSVSERRIIQRLPAEEDFSFHRSQPPEEMAFIFRAFNLQGQLLGLAKYQSEKRSFQPFLVIS